MKADKHAKLLRKNSPNRNPGQDLAVYYHLGDGVARQT
jgi:hypothetical protein